MRITKEQMRKIILEEVTKMLQTEIYNGPSEGPNPDDYDIPDEEDEEGDLEDDPDHDRWEEEEDMRLTDPDTFYGVKGQL